MFDESTICPYSGLRSFSEEESIFFKGRDKQIDQITSLLEKNKFLMVTGASGEGKSSLVYAGMIPNARAGFFKAKYNNWQVVDFRPERTPLVNLSKAIASKLNYDSHETVETELQRGYSALVEVYKNSNWFYDENDTNWQSKSDDAKGASKRESANLLIIVDQFEEFFTNPENYSKNSPSEDSQVTLNVLLETAKIALKENLPIYVVCTMRSDYIGQCSAFRGLPEAIGFSQFFVPRLKRNELKLIIEEPALLNGNSISQRLTERLLFDLSEGIDQLPILQHTLSHIWHAASNGKEELDLIHYALVGGMPAAELPDEDKPRFRDWFKSLPEYQRHLYHTPGIKRVIEIHANQLYEGAYNYYTNNNPGTSVTLPDVKRVVALTFACLTKIDDSRAVRNRMTLAEITGIINKPHITSSVVNGILSIFREQDNSFIRPFVTDDPVSISLADDTVLDITHESLIRNWDLLNKWANKEYEYYVTFLDFKKQLNRWLDSDKSKGYLLPIGPLSYFENWEKQCQPNKYWIKRYKGNTDDDQNVLKDSAHLLDNAHEFLRKSNRKVLIARTFMRYGANRIAAVLAITTVFFLSAFYFYDAETKRNEHIIKSTVAKAESLLSSPDIQLDDKADFLLVRERGTPGSLMAYINTIEDEQFQIDIANDCYDGLLYFDKKFSGSVKEDLLSFIDDHISNHAPHNSDNDRLNELNKLSTLMAYDYYYNSDANTLALIKKVNNEIYTSILKGLKGENQLSAGEINRGLQFYLTFNNPGTEDVGSLIELLSPFREESKHIFDRIYPKGSFEPNGRIRLDYNGGYHTVASLYAITGNINNLYRSLDSLQLTPDYYNGIPFNNYANLLGYLYQYNHQDDVAGVVSYIANNSEKSELELIQDLIDRTGYLKYLYSSNLNAQVSESNAGYFGPNLNFLDPEKVRAIFNYMRQKLAEVKNDNERNYLQAMLSKQQAIFKHKYLFDRGLTINELELADLLKSSIKYYNNVAANFLAEEVTVNYTYYGGGPRERKMTRNELFIYPDYMEGYMSNTYHSTLFFDFLVEEDLLSKLYTSASDLELLNYYIGNYYEVYTFFFELTYKNDPVLSLSRIEEIKSFAGSHEGRSSFDFNLVNLVLANGYFIDNNTKQGLAAYNDLSIGEYQKTSKSFEYLNESFFLNQVRDLANNLSKIGMYTEATEQIETMTRPSHKILGYFCLAENLYEQNYNPLAFDYLDSAYSNIKLIKERDLRNREDYRYFQTYTLSKIGGSNSSVLINKIIKSIHELNKPRASLFHVIGFANGNDYYQASLAIHKNLTESLELNCYYALLYFDVLSKETVENRMLWSGLDKSIDHRINYLFNVRGL
jgi:energy-coupling factor transporter ATP-binding protein EcfA2